MHHRRNVRDAIPLNWGRRQIEVFSAKVAAGIGMEPGLGVVDAFHALGGRYEEVPSTFGLRGDRILVMGASDLTFEGERRDRDNVLGLGESLGVLFLHYPIALREYGEDVTVAVPRITPDGVAETVSREALWFGVGLVMPRDAFLAAHADDPAPASLARAFGVPLRIAEGRMRSLGLLSGDAC